jgi:hypothetical protein
MVSRAGSLSLVTVQPKTHAFAVVTAISITAAITTRAVDAMITLSALVCTYVGTSLNESWFG